MAICMHVTMESPTYIIREVHHKTEVIIINGIKLITTELIIYGTIVIRSIKPKIL